MNNKIIAPHLFRHACKVFDPDKKINEKDFEIILEVGRLSPSSFGLEPWKILVVQNKSLLEKLREYSWGAQKQLQTASHSIIILARKENGVRFDSKYIKHMKMDIQKYPEDLYLKTVNKLKDFQEKDFGLLGQDSDKSLFEWSARQTYIMQGNMMTAAAQLGIDSCPIEGFNKEKITEILASDFNVDIEEFGISVMICFGYRINEPRPKTRQKMEDVVEWFR